MAGELTVHPQHSTAYLLVRSRAHTQPAPITHQTAWRLQRDQPTRFLAHGALLEQELRQLRSFRITHRREVCACTHHNEFES
jgi:hypothetical protein